MPLLPNMEQDDYLDILQRRKWMIVFSVLIILFGATVYCVLTPDQYRSIVKIRIIPPAVPEGMVRSNVSDSTGDRLYIIRQDILSKPRLLGLINEVGISTIGFSEKSADDMVAIMRERIVVGIDSRKMKNLKSDSKIDLDPNTFILSFDHEKALVAKDVASRLASSLVGENIKSRETVTQETSEFLASQVEETRKRLEQQEEKMKRYKLQFSGELPQQEQANQNRLQRLQDQIKGNRDAVARLEDRKIFMQAQISELEGKIRQAEQNPWEAMNTSNPLATPNKLLTELAMRRKKLEEMNAKFTPLHPSVVQARWEVEQLEAKISKLREVAKKSAKQSAGEASDPSSSSLDTADLLGTSWEQGEVRRLREQIGGMNLEISALKRESANTGRIIDDIQRKMERLPQREQEMISLTRDYENLKTSYDELLKKGLESRISGKLDERRKGEQFQILEPANLPPAPFKPERLKVLGLALLASLVIGVGGAIGFEMLDPTLRGRRDFKSFFDIPILACLPVIQDDRLKHRIVVRRTAVFCGLASILGAYVIFLTLHGEKVMSILQTLGFPIGGKN